MRMHLQLLVTATVFAACGGTRSPPPVAVAEPARPDAGVASAPDPSVDPEPVAAVPPVEPAPVASATRLAWVNPARCTSPCTYEPTDDLVRVDDRGVASPKGKHRVHRSIEEPLRDLVAAARAAGHKIKIESAFRSYADQQRVFETTKQIGRAARPGHSEHQLGTAVDFRMPTTAAIEWLGAHAAELGFALSYPEGKQRITGYRPEPWHVRFVGVELAEQLRTSNSTLEELFRAQPGLGESGDCRDCPSPSSHKACASITLAGRCDGDVLTWCYDGALATVDCAAFKLHCGSARVDGVDCMAQ